MLARYKKDSKPLLGQGTLYFMPVRTAIFMGETVDNMPSYIPEMGALLHAAQKYLCGEISHVWLRGYVLECLASPAVQDNLEIQKELAEWHRMQESTWDEWGLNPNPLPESEFRDSVKSCVDYWLLIQNGA